MVRVCLKTVLTTVGSKDALQWIIYHVKTKQFKFIKAGVRHLGSCM